MNLPAAIFKLQPHQLLNLHNTLITVGLAFETGGDYQEIFRVEKHRHTGVQHRIYKRLQTYTGADIDTLLRVLIPIQPLKVDTH